MSSVDGNGPDSADPSKCLGACPGTLYLFGQYLHQRCCDSVAQPIGLGLCCRKGVWPVVDGILRAENQMSEKV